VTGIGTGIGLGHPPWYASRPWVEGVPWMMG
jgi:hypothetical protein